MTLRWSKNRVPKNGSGWYVKLRIFKAARVDGHPHQFRHAVAKRLLVAWLPVSHVATLLGNTESIVRKHYSQWIPERQQALDKAIRAVWKV